VRFYYFVRDKVFTLYIPKIATSKVKEPADGAEIAKGKT
jgi:hypothetical protein